MSPTQQQRPLTIPAEAYLEALSLMINALALR